MINLAAFAVLCMQFKLINVSKVCALNDNTIKVYVDGEAVEFKLSMNPFTNKQYYMYV